MNRIMKLVLLIGLTQVVIACGASGGAVEYCEIEIDCEGEGDKSSCQTEYDDFEDTDCRQAMDDAGACALDNGSCEDGEYMTGEACEEEVFAVLAACL